MFSEREKSVLTIIGKKKISIPSITEKLLGGPDMPFNAEISVGNTVRRIIKKCEYHKLNWTLARERKNNITVFFRSEK